MGKHTTGKNLAFFLIVMILVLVMLYSGLRILESTVFYSGEGPVQTAASKTVTRNGTDYFPRQDITVVMVLGIDRSGPVEPSQYHRNSGAADLIMLLVFDEQKEVCSVVHLNRDTMLDMSVLGVRGEYAGTAYGQLALAHTYGSGLEDSCENVKETLERFLPGMTVDHYVAMNMDAVAILNDAVGGVTVTVRDDFSKVDASIPQGVVTLQGEQALTFVRGRGDVGDQLNLSRMERQKEYMSHFLSTFRTRAGQSESFVLKTYESLTPYMVSDISANALDSMLRRYRDYSVAEAVSLDGENVLGEEAYEFYADGEKLEALTLDLFYGPKK